ncbi:MAG TPA: avidin/streptavidin family protein [Terracidiphilus sp.]|nr:avidin/streptavidin family protein [Terracidiphilus sp.]
MRLFLSLDKLTLLFIGGDGMPINRKELKPLSALGKTASLALVGVWQNELSSEMTITSFDGTTFSGSYTSSVSSGSGSVTGSLLGYVSGDAISFIVNWAPTYSSVTAWSGVLLGNGEDGVFMYTLWQMASTPEEQQNYWESIQAGADLFWQQSS